jgi:hypothetical protein
MPVFSSKNGAPGTGSSKTRSTVNRGAAVVAPRARIATSQTVRPTCPFVWCVVRMIVPADPASRVVWPAEYARPPFQIPGASLACWHAHMPRQRLTKGKLGSRKVSCRHFAPRCFCCALTSADGTHFCRSRLRKSCSKCNQTPYPRCDPRTRTGAACSVLWPPIDGRQTPPAR